MKIREVKRDGEKLVEVGKEAEARRSRVMSYVQNAQQRVYSAQRALDRASETDENGETAGDVGAAQAELDAAMMDLEYYEGELDAAQAEVDSINDQKRETIRVLDQYVEGEDRNLSVIRQLQAKSFGGNVAALAAAIINQISMAETTRNNLLNSLGLSGNTSTRFLGNTGGGINQILSTPSTIIVADAKQSCVDLLRSRKESFAAHRWALLTPAQRGAALNGLAIEAGRAMGIDVKGAKFYEGPRSSRGRFSGDGYLYLNSDVLEDTTQREDALDTIFHEGRHAFQREAINNPKAYGISEETAEAWRNNQPPNYINSNDDEMGYFQQPVERDAYSFAGDVIREGLK